MNVNIIPEDKLHMQHVIKGQHTSSNFFGGAQVFVSYGLQSLLLLLECIHLLPKIVKLRCSHFLLVQHLYLLYVGGVPIIINCLELAAQKNSSKS